ncbi:serine protease snake-like [Teleopsis dalmanni]|uniref:serine protease snake-like n=1 Tax=Teleopsis dalmanni TaxID=139649 RepID=UPI0018CC8F88|nr:serine protease snake-like [Teleopsis dalmanni]
MQINIKFVILILFMFFCEVNLQFNFFNNNGFNNGFRALDPSRIQFPTEFNRPFPTEFNRPPVPPWAFGFGNRFPPHPQPWLRPHRPHKERYRDFAIVFRDLDNKTRSDKEFEQDMNDDFNGRSVVAPGQYPHMAALGFRSNNFGVEFKCGGSLISEMFVLTAAHCCNLNGQVPTVVKLGDINLKEREFDNEPQRRRIVDIILHPFYNSSYYYNDIALLQLSRPIEYTHFVRPIRLWAGENIPYDKVFTMGYGSTSFAQAPTNILTELNLTIVALNECNRTMPPDTGAPFGIVESQVCAKDFERNRDTCQGDSGGPLQLNLERRRRPGRFRYYLVGITSYGAFCRSQYPGIYTRVSFYIDWIASIVWPGYFENFK